MEVEVDEKELKAAGAELFSDGRRGLRIHGWEIETRNRSILNSSTHELWEKKLETCHMPEMIFGDSCLVLKHVKSGTTIHFNAFDALIGWKKEALPPVEVPAAAQWKFRCKPSEQVILDYDYTFTTPYGGSETITLDADKHEGGEVSKETCNLHWEDCKEKIDVVALASKEPILFYDEVVLYEDELADNGVSLLTVKVRVMPSGWFLLLRFWLRVDGVLMRLRDTRMHCAFGDNVNPIILRESCWREATFQALAAKGYPSEAAAYNDPSIISQRLPVVMSKTQKLKHLKSLLEPQGRVITFISDRGTGLLSAFDKVFAGHAHLFCYKHLVANLVGKYRGKVENWCRAFYTSCRYGIMANGIAGSFNSWIGLERMMPVYCMLDQTRIKQMVMAGERRDEAERWTTELTPKMEERLKEQMENSRRFSVHYSSPGVYERPPGRPRVKRFKSIGEVEKKLIRCGRCGKMGTHNKLSCTEPLVQQ